MPSPVAVLLGTGMFGGNDGVMCWVGAGTVGNELEGGGVGKGRFPGGVVCPPYGDGAGGCLGCSNPTKTNWKILTTRWIRVQNTWEKVIQ